RIGRVHQNEPPHDGIELSVKHQVSNVAGPEGDLGEARRFGSLDRSLDDFRILVDANDRAGRADELRGEEGHITRTAPDIEYSHPRADSRILEKVAGQRFEESRALLEA